MNPANPVIVGVGPVSPDEVIAVARRGARVELSDEALAKIEEGRSVIEALARDSRPHYGVSTGFGALAGKHIPAERRVQLQRGVVRSHAAGSGAEVEREVVRAMMLLRLSTMATGRTGIRTATAAAYAATLSAGITPVVPEYGSLGCSGDLAPLAHCALAVTGEGQVRDAEGGLRDAADALREAGISPVALQEKEGLALINGTDGMLGMLVLAIADLRMLLATADITAAMSVEGLLGTDAAFDDDLQRLRPQVGQAAAAANMRAVLADSAIVASHRGPEDTRVQDAYSLRCAPQVHGAVRDALDTARRAMEIELNSVTDNPLVIDGEIFSGGNFHGEPLALQLDALAVALTVLAGISERRIDRLVNPALNEELPPFLANHAGLESGFMMLQVTAAALVGENRVLSHPASTGSITTSGNKEDFVSMGMASAMKLKQVVRNTRYVLAIELVAAARALDCLSPLKSSAVIERVRTALRDLSAPWTADRSLAPDIEKLAGWIASGALREV